MKHVYSHGGTWSFHDHCTDVQALPGFGGWGVRLVCFECGASADLQAVTDRDCDPCQETHKRAATKAQGAA